MKRFLLLLLTVLVPALLEFGCKKDGAAGPTGPAGTTITGTMTGFVRLVNEDHTNVVDRHGVTVSLEGTSLSTLSDSSGKFTLTAVPSGIYTIAASKAGYGTAKQPAVQFIGSGTSFVGTFFLEQFPGYNVSTVTASPSSPNILVSGTISNSTSYYRYVFIFVGPTSTTSSDPSTFSSFTNAYVAASATTFSATLYGSTLTRNGFSSGNTVYIAAYSTGGNFGSRYLDINTGRSSYNAIGTVKTANTVMP